MNDERSARIEIPASLYRSIEERIKGTGFESVDQYVTYVLRELMARDSEEPVLDREDEEKIRERLRSLGYLD